jgi:hypothetical protein
LFDLIEPAVDPAKRVLDHARANHVQVDVNKTTVQVLVNRDGRSMIAIFPECAVASFAPIVFLPSAASDQLHAISDNIWTGVSNQKVNVVAGHDVIKYGQTETLLRFENPAQIRLPIAPSELAQGQIPISVKVLNGGAAIERSEHLERLELPSLHW